MTKKQKNLPRDKSFDHPSTDSSNEEENRRNLTDSLDRLYRYIQAARQSFDWHYYIIKSYKKKASKYRKVSSPQRS